MVMSPLIGVAVGAAITLGSVVLVVMIRARRERVAKPRHEKTPEINELPNSQQYPMQNIQPTIDTDPDVIPNKFGKCHCQT